MDSHDHRFWSLLLMTILLINAVNVSLSKTCSTKIMWLQVEKKSNNNKKELM